MQENIERFIDKKTRNLNEDDRDELKTLMIESKINIEKLRKKYKEYKKDTVSTQNKGRSQSRMNDITRWIKNKEIKTYLDVGCSEASITEELAKYVKAEESYGVDVKISKENTEQVTFIENKPDTLPFEDNKFDLITAFMALHHFRDISVMLDEIYRVLKPGGIFIIREHDVRNREFGIFLNKVHILYAIINDEEIDMGRYNNKETWSKKHINPKGFKFRGLKMKKDIFNSYYACYQK